MIHGVPWKHTMIGLSLADYDFIHLGESVRGPVSGSRALRGRLHRCLRTVGGQSGEHCVSAVYLIRRICFGKGVGYDQSI